MANDNGGKLHVIDSGESGRKTVVLLHAVGLDLSWFGDIVPGLRAAGFRVVGIDLPGHGLSPALPSGFSLADIAQRVEASLDGLGGGPFYILGHSVGGMLAQMIAVRRPDIVSGIVPTCTRCQVPDEGRSSRARAMAVRQSGMAGTLQTTLERWFTPTFRVARPEVIDRCTKTLLRDDPEVNAGMWEAIADLAVNRQLGAIRCPTLVIAGDADSSCPPEAGKEIVDSVAGEKKLVVISGGSHMAPVEMPERIVAEVAAYFS
jgi:3-oxoadipate enol-lactonase